MSELPIFSSQAHLIEPGDNVTSIATLPRRRLRRLAYQKAPAQLHAVIRQNIPPIILAPSHPPDLNASLQHLRSLPYRANLRVQAPPSLGITDLLLPQHLLPSLRTPLNAPKLDMHRFKLLRSRNGIFKFSIDAP